MRTSQGWRIKHRTVYAKKSGSNVGTELPPLRVPVRVAKDAGNGPKHNGLAVEDYLDIQQLITTYPMALAPVPAKAMSTPTSSRLTAFSCPTRSRTRDARI